MVGLAPLSFNRATRTLLALAAGALLSVGAVQAAPPTKPPAERSVEEWLERMHEASRQRSYVGTFVVSSGAGGLSSARIWHACKGEQQVERGGLARLIWPVDDVKIGCLRARHTEVEALVGELAIAGEIQAIEAHQEAFAPSPA